MKKAMSLLTATAMAATLLAGCGGGTASSSAAPAADSTSTEASSTAAEPAADAAAEEGKVLNIWCWNDEFQSRFNDYYPGVKEIAADKSTTTLDNGVTVKWTINPNDNNNYQNKLDEALLKQDSAASSPTPQTPLWTLIPSSRRFTTSAAPGSPMKTRNPLQRSAVRRCLWQRTARSRRPSV